MHVAQSVPITRRMKTKAVSLAITSVLAVAGLTGSVASAQSGDTGGPPKTKAECKKFLKSVDAALVWENKRYDKVVAKLEKKRNALQKKAATIQTQQDAIDRRLAEIDAALNDEANPPSDEDGARMVTEYNDLLPTHDQNARDINDLQDEIDGMKFDFSEAKKLHAGNVRSTIKYR